MSVNHIGFFPFPYDWGNGPLGPNSYNNVGQGGVTDNTATPDNTTQFPLGMSLVDAMRLQWKINYWTVHAANDYQDIELDIFLFDFGYGMFSGTGTDYERKRHVTFHNGFAYSTGPSIPAMIPRGGGVYFSASMVFFFPEVVGSPQIYFNPTSGLYIPEIGLNVIIMEDGSGPSGRDYTMEATLGPIGTPGGDNVNADLGGSTVVMSGAADPSFGFINTISWTPTPY